MKISKMSMEWRSTMVPALQMGRYVFFLNSLENISPFLGPLITLFETFGDVSFGFEIQSGQLYLQLTETYL